MCMTKRADEKAIPSGYRVVGRLLKKQMNCRHFWIYWSTRMRCQYCHVVVQKLVIKKVLRLCVECHEPVSAAEDFGEKAELFVPLHERCFWSYSADWDDYQRNCIIGRFTDATVKYKIADREALDEDLRQQLNLAKFAIRESVLRARAERARKCRVVKRASLKLPLADVLAIREARHLAYLAREKVRKSKDSRSNHHKR